MKEDVTGFINAIEMAIDYNLPITPEEMGKYNRLIEEGYSCNKVTIDDVYKKLCHAIEMFAAREHHAPNRLIISRNYIDIMKSGFTMQYVSDENLTYRGIPISIDECSSNQIHVGFMMQF